ncbi:hypothetical protein PsYK624_151930 [Phanerochaete sordida]|uniref:Uncharacterized protein n=1 Tax=Phanerochaete sordida TaxID=48140 RepID=A0A9P3GSW5_9APHY|nr:hypothetical protein PsYK624_151930 [Phanerochaete sordida]
MNGLVILQRSCERTESGLFDCWDTRTNLIRCTHCVPGDACGTYPSRRRALRRPTRSTSGLHRQPTQNLCLAYIQSTSKLSLPVSLNEHV